MSPISWYMLVCGALLAAIMVVLVYEFVDGMTIYSSGPEEY